MAAKDELGRRGEDLAVRYLEQQGLVILSRNWRCRLGEVDVVATDGNQLIVCEVKTRSSPHFGQPSEAVHFRKIRQVRRVTQAWLATHRAAWVRIRFDVVSVLAPPGEPPTIQHVEAAF